MFFRARSPRRGSGWRIYLPVRGGIGGLRPPFEQRRCEASAMERRETRAGWGEIESPLDHHHLGADLDAVIEVDHVLVAHADAAGRHLGADRPRFVGAVDAIERGPEVERARAERILGTTGHVAGQIRTAPEHLVGRRPVRPFTLHRDFLDARPGKPRAADSDAVANRLAAVCDEVEQTLARIDDDGARLPAAEQELEEAAAEISLP